jgi:flagellar hook-length control protein FliK
MIDSAIRSLAVVPTPATVPTPPDRAAHPTVAAHPFAEVLRQNRLAAATPVATPASGADATPDAGRPAPVESNGSSDAMPSDPAPAQRDATQAKTRTAGSSRESSRSTPVDASSTDAPARPSTDDAHANGNAARDPATAANDPTPSAATLPGAPPDLARRIDADADDRSAAMRGKAAATSDLARGRDAATEAPEAAAPAGTGTPHGDSAGSTTDRGVALAAAADASASGDAGIDKNPGSSSTASFAGLLAESRASHAATSPVERSNSDAVTPLAQPVGFTGNGAAVASPALPTPVHSPDFAAAFGLQVSVLAKDGVQHAELHLNPADMGPVSIQITLDGSQARVDFGADVAATRQAIEAGLPELASALRDAGFTLAGGGVAQHSGANGGDRGDTDPRANGSASARLASARVAGIDTAAQRLASRAAAGGVDLYA